MQVEVWWGQEGDRFDALAQVLHKRIEVQIAMRGGQRLLIRDEHALRQFTFQELKLLAHLAGFQVRCCQQPGDMTSVAPLMFGKPLLNNVLKVDLEK